jgi:hypothetical protein
VRLCAALAVALLAITHVAPAWGQAQEDEEEKPDEEDAEEVKRDFKRMDLGVPAVPALVALGISAEKVTRPGTIRDLSTAIANGMDGDGAFHSGLAIEIAPLRLAKARAGAFETLRLSIASVGSTKDGVTTGRAAAALRWTALVYDPTEDARLEGCLAAALPPPPALPRTVTLPAPPPGLSNPVVLDRKAETRLKRCREGAKLSNLAQNGFEVAVSIDGTADGSLRLQDLASPHIVVWMSGSLAFNSFDWDGTHRWTKTKATYPYGLQPTFMFRYDRTDVPLAGDDRQDVFAGLRLPIIWPENGMFFEVGFTRRDLNEAVGDATSTVRLGFGSDWKLADSVWLGIYVGQDLGDGAEAFEVLSNVKLALGKERSSL